MFNFLKKKVTREVLGSPAKGKIISLSKVKDKMFANKMLGDGIAFILEKDILKAPCDGEVSMIAATKHAFGITSSLGAEILIHVGLDTVNLNGEGFEFLVDAHQKVVAGEPILKIDRAFMKSQGIDLTTPMIITNGDSLKMEISQEEKVVDYEEPLITITK